MEASDETRAILQELDRALAAGGALLPPPAGGMMAPPGFWLSAGELTPAPPAVDVPWLEAVMARVTRGDATQLQDVTALSPRVAATLTALHNVLTAAGMQQHRLAISAAMDGSVRFDVPHVAGQGADVMRWALYLEKWLIAMDMDPLLVAVTPLPTGTHVRTYAIVRVSPRLRTWWLPPTMLLPQTLHVHATLDISVLEDGAIAAVKSRAHNLPALPMLLLRWPLTLLLGRLPAWGEQLWDQLQRWGSGGQVPAAAVGSGPLLAAESQTGKAALRPEAEPGRASGPVRVTHHPHTE